MTDYKHIIYEKNEKIARIKLNRPQYLNAQTHVMLDEMDEAFHLAAEDNDVRVIVLSGEGESFSAGHDLGTPAEKEDAIKRAYEIGPAGTYDRFEKIYQRYIKIAYESNESGDQAIENSLREQT
jgi:enoyl-CoA hydratase/carnithine racemase